MANITAANSIYPVCMAEWEERRLYQDRAIGNCEILFQEMAYALSILPVDVDKYMRYVDIIQRQIALLKGWRKSDNKLKARLLKKKWLSMGCFPIRATTLGCRLLAAGLTSAMSTTTVMPTTTRLITVMPSARISCIRAKCRFNADTELQERGKYPSAR